MAGISNKTQLEALQKTMEGHLDTVNTALLNEAEFLTGSEMTIADFSLATTVTYLEACNYDITKWGNICSFVERIKKLPYWEECNEGLAEFGEYFKTNFIK